MNTPISRRIVPQSPSLRKRIIEPRETRPMCAVSYCTANGFTSLFVAGDIFTVVNIMAASEVANLPGFKLLAVEAVQNG